VLTAVPFEVETDIRPDATAFGTFVEIDVAVAELTDAELRFKFTLSFVAVVSKLVPVTVSKVPGTPEAGVKLVMVGAPMLPLVMVNALVLVAVPEGVVTVMVPLVVPEATIVTS